MPVMPSSLKIKPTKIYIQYSQPDFERRLQKQHPRRPKDLPKIMEKPVLEPAKVSPLKSLFLALKNIQQ